MASVYRRDGSPHWMARFKGPDGQWTARSTKETDRARALKLAFELEGAGSTMRTENPTAAQVDRVVRDLWERHTGKRIALNRTDEFFRAWVANKKLKPKSLVRYNQVIDEFLVQLGERAAFDLKSVEPSHVQTWVNANEAKGRSGRTIELNVKIVGSVFNAAVRAGLVVSNPAATVQLPHTISEEREPFTIGEVQTLLDHAKGDWKTAIMLAAYAGLRLGDATRLKWENVDLASGMLHFVPEKTSRKGKRLDVPMHKELAAYLDILAGTDKAQGSPLVCPALSSREISGRKGLSAEFATLMAGAHVAGNAVTPRDGRTRKFSTKTFHSLRHFNVSSLANSGVAEDVRAALVGHADPKETKRYSHLSESTLRKAINKVGRAKK